MLILFNLVLPKSRNLNSIFGRSYKMRAFIIYYKPPFPSEEDRKSESHYQSGPCLDSVNSSDHFYPSFPPCACALHDCNGIQNISPAPHLLSLQFKQTSHHVNVPNTLLRFFLQGVKRVHLPSLFICPASGLYLSIVNKYTFSQC